MAKNKNPKLREKIKARHEAHLAHREEREQKERERFTQAPTGKQARHQANAYANREYNPVVRGIREEAASLGKQAQQANQWYNQLGAEQAAAAQGELQGANTYASTLTQQLAQANAQNEAFLSQQNATNQQFAEQTGIPMPASSGQAAAAGANVGAAMNVALNAPTLGAAYNHAALTNRLGLASKERGHEVQQGILGERKKVRQDLRAAQKQKGQAYVGRLGELKESARKQELDAKAFELEGQQTALQAQEEQEKLAQDERQSRRSAATSRANSERTAASSAASTAASTTSAEASAQNARREQEEFDAERRYKKNHHGMTPAEVAAAKKERQPSRAERNDKRQELKNGYVAGKNAVRAFDKAEGTTAKNYTPTQWSQLEEHLIAPKSAGGSDLEPAVAHKVIEILKKQNGWSPASDPNGESLGR
jgi:hypothetical protein